MAANEDDLTIFFKFLAKELKGRVNEDDLSIALKSAVRNSQSVLCTKSALAIANAVLDFETCPEIQRSNVISIQTKRPENTRLCGELYQCRNPNCKLFHF
jgi:hypothetical protein